MSFVVAVLVQSVLFTGLSAALNSSPVNAAEAPAITLKDRQWEQLVIPADTSSLTLRQLFGDELPATDYGDTWVLYLYDGLRNQYTDPGIDGLVPQGAGIWMIQITGVPVSLKLPADIPTAKTSISNACANTQGCAETTLPTRPDQPAFSMVGSALTTTVLVDQLHLRTDAGGSACEDGCRVNDAASRPFLSPTIWHYDSTSNSYQDLATTGQIEAWQAAWFLTETTPQSGNHTLLFPASNINDDNARAEASRFLAQATFGPTSESINTLRQTSYSDWVDAQFQLPVTSMLDLFDIRQAANPTSQPSRDWVFESFWTQAVEANDQLRQRMAFALSQLFVISLRDGAVAAFPRGVADFYTMLARGAFGNFRDLLEQVTLHPMMGGYLSHLGNLKGDALTGQVPDENFAREIMQLFTIGLYELNPDGSVRTGTDNSPTETYNNNDVQGLARVFTGFSWSGPDTSTGRFQGWISSADRDVIPMQPYPRFHSTLEKRFLGTVIDAQSTANPAGDLATALDTLFNHPNVGPFIGKQLIQRLVSSNPSPGYIARVTSAFNNNGNGVRGDMRAVIGAILLDTEARDNAQAALPSHGRIREPILRVTHWIRSFNATSQSGHYSLLGTDDPATSLGMTVLRSPSVFNFYRPGYVPPNTPIAQAGRVSPEMQLTHETSVAGYLNSMLNAIELGTGSNNEVRSNYPDSAPLAADPDALLDHINVLLLHGSMSATLRDWLMQAIETVDITNTDDLPAALLKRAQIAVYLAMASPEYIVLK